MVIIIIIITTFFTSYLAAQWRRSLNFFLPSPLCQVSVRVHVCLRMGKKERIGLVGEMLCRLAPLVTYEFPGFPEFEWLRFPEVGRPASMLEVGRLAFWKECKEKTAVRNSSELRGKSR